MKVHIKSPTRVDFSGGTLDLWPLYALVGGGLTINLSINIFTQVEIERLNDSKITVDISDLGYERVFENWQEFFACPDSEVQMVSEVAKLYPNNEGYRIQTQSQSPVGGGLGGSSSLMISLIKAYDQWNSQDRDLLNLVRTASNIEAKILQTPTGTQDYFPAAQWGLQAIHYQLDKTYSEMINFPVKEFSSKLFLVYTGRPHHSGINNWEVYKKAIEGDKQTLNALEEIKRISLNVYSACRSQDWDILPTLFNEEFKWRCELSSGFASPEIETVKKIALSHGADAVKICGAGGGGCVFVWGGEREALQKSISEKGFRVIDIDPVVEING